jgi:hypothetical protein
MAIMHRQLTSWPDLLKHVKTLMHLIHTEPNREELELEVRIGTMTRQRQFHPGVTEPQWQRILTLLTARHGSTHPVSSVDVNWSNGPRQRVRTTIASQRAHHIIKERILSLTYASSPFALRLSLNREKPLDVVLPEKNDNSVDSFLFMRHKTRFSFLHDHLRYDLTKVCSGTTHAECTLATPVYEVECEWSGNMADLDEKQVHSLLQSLVDVWKSTN